MKLIDWLRPGMGIKRWGILAVLGIVCISFGLSFILGSIYRSILENIFSFLLIISGCIFIFLSIKYLFETFLYVVYGRYFKISLDADRLSNLLYEKRILIKGPKIVTIGGGTGLSTMLRGLKAYSSNITAVVTVADDGGGSGELRQDLGILPPGDIRNCIMALADTEPIMEELMQYRFNDGKLKGQSFGNLFLAAMDGVFGSFEEAVKKMSDVLAVTGRVLPVTLNDITLCAELEDGEIVFGETNIVKEAVSRKSKIKRVYLNQDNVKPVDEVIEAIGEADIIILGPGSLFTSVIPNLLVAGVCEALKKSTAKKVYICNVMTQPGETDNFTLCDHIDALEKHSYIGIIDYCIINTKDVPDNMREKYLNDGADIVKYDLEELKRREIEAICDSYLGIEKGFIRHDSKKLACSIMALIADAVLAKDKKRILDYFYIKERLKKR